MKQKQYLKNVEYFQLECNDNKVCMFEKVFRSIIIQLCKKLLEQKTHKLDHFY